MLVYIGVLNRDLILQYLTQQVTGKQIFKYLIIFHSNLTFLQKLQNFEFVQVR